MPRSSNLFKRKKLFLASIKLLAEKPFAFFSAGTVNGEIRVVFLDMRSLLKVLVLRGIRLLKRYGCFRSFIRELNTFRGNHLERIAVLLIEMLLPMDNSQSALRTLVYFDLFDYPLTQEEIGLFMDRKVTPDELTFVMNQLSEQGLVFPHGEYFSLKNAENLESRRKTGNQLASRLLPIAFRISSFLFHFPFVRGIGISGSLSKNFADENADIDYFIITKANRLWITRTLMHLYKKLTFLVGRQHFYCMNYYIDEEALAIQEKNVYTAVEVATLIPVCGNGSMENFFTANAWIDDYYPNYVIDVESRKNSGHSWFKRSMEFLINIFPANKLDNYLMKITTNRWKRKEAAQMVNYVGRRMGLHTDKHFSKPNPNHLQKQILVMYETRWREIQERAQLLVTSY